jgi:hypothetical protein
LRNKELKKGGQFFEENKFFGQKKEEVIKGLAYIPRSKVFNFKKKLKIKK